MSDLRELYQEVILDHHRRPRNFGALDQPTGRAEGHNPLCGDRVTVYVRLAGDRIADVKFEGSGCAISKASASLMTDSVKGRSVDESAALFHAFQTLVTGGSPPPDAELGKLEVFAGVRDYPSRVKCATLAWHALQAAILQPDRTVTTESSAD
jgi:nitrogen fixation protein NifU and related proteins